MVKQSKTSRNSSKAAVRKPVRASAASVKKTAVKSRPAAGRSAPSKSPAKAAGKPVAAKASASKAAAVKVTPKAKAAAPAKAAPAPKSPPPKAPVKAAALAAPAKAPAPAPVKEIKAVPAKPALVPAKPALVPEVAKVAPAKAPVPKAASVSKPKAGSAKAKAAAAAGPVAPKGPPTVLTMSPAQARPVAQAERPVQPQHKYGTPAAKMAPVLPPGPPRPRINFAVADHVVYPTHGVGRIVRIDRQEIAGFQLELLVVEFEKDKLTVSVPVAKAASVGMRRLSSPQQMRTALETLKGRARIKRAMWSRRAQEYEAKINSGDPVSIAEVVRDLHRNAGQPDQSYSERQIYEKALDRLAHELAAVEKIDDDTAAKRLEKMLKAA